MKIGHHSRSKFIRSQLCSKMKVFVVIFVVFVSAAARGSGPYLPSGWRPQGPAFLLPSEVKEPAVSSPKEEAFQETEASGSDALREYGPPKLGEVFLNVNQALPDVVTEQSFSAQVKEDVSAAVEAVNDEEQVAAVKEETPTATESQLIETATETIRIEIEELSIEQSTIKSQTGIGEQEKEILIQSEEVKESITPTTEEVVIVTSADNEVVSLAVQELVQDIIPTVTEEIVNVIQQEAVPTAALGDIVAPAIDQDISQQILEQNVATAVVDVAEEAAAPISLAIQDLVQEVVSNPLQEIVVDEKTEGVNNVDEVIVNLENEVKAVEAQAVENIGDISSTQKAAGDLVQDPAGSLDYNPPGFAVYGPPLQEDLTRLAAAETTSNIAWDNIGERRRRLSPRFSSLKNKSK